MTKFCRLGWIIISLSFPLLAGAADLTADETVVATTREVISRLTMDQAKLQNEPGYIEEVVHELIVPHMDFHTMAGLVLGKDWSVLSDAMKDCFTRGFRNMLVERYSDILLSFRDQDIHYQPAKPVGTQGYVTVLQSLSRDGRKPLTILYPLRQDGAAWKVVDLVVDDVSLVRSYRMMFDKKIKQDGLADFIHSFQECAD